MARVNAAEALPKLSPNTKSVALRYLEKKFEEIVCICNRLRSRQQTVLKDTFYGSASYNNLRTYINSKIFSSIIEYTEATVLKLLHSVIHMFPRLYLRV